MSETPITLTDETGAALNWTAWNARLQKLGSEIRVVDERDDFDLVGHKRREFIVDPPFVRVLLLISGEVKAERTHVPRGSQVAAMQEMLEAEFGPIPSA